MRRISLALALLGAVAGAGCGGGANPKSSGSEGVPGAKFTVTIRGEFAYDTDPGPSINNVYIPGGGVVTGPGLDCGFSGGVAHLDCTEDFDWGSADAPTIVAVTATPDTANGYNYFAFAGNCMGSGPCSVSGNADRLVLVRFAKTQAGLGVHPNFSDPQLHKAAFETLAYRCTDCHGAQHQGLGLAPSCGQCHDNLPPQGEDTNILQGDHFLATSHAWEDHGGWSQDCQRCHTNGGFRDYVGLDGSADYLGTTFKSTNPVTATTAACEEAGTCDPNAYAYGPLKCSACHNAASEPTENKLTVVNFHSYKSVVTDGASALCSQCHSARESNRTVLTRIGTAGPDEVLSGTFPNPHYAGAAATLYGASASGWAEYAGQTYAGPFAHVGLGRCTDCHDAHTGLVEITANTCGKCHAKADGDPVASLQDLEEARQFGFEGDIDGDGSEEGLKAEIDGLEAELYAAMRTYAVEVVGTAITFGEARPYFWADANDNGIYDPEIDGTTSATQYKWFTPRLLRAAWNYNWVSHADPAAWVHNARYVIQVLVDTINDIKAGLGDPPFTGIRDVAAEPSIAGLGGHYQASGHNSGGCGRCHAGEAFRDFIGADGTADNHLSAGTTADKAAALDVTTGIPSGINCNTCHVANWDRVTVPSNQIRFLGATWDGSAAVDAAKIVTADATTAICGQCHTGQRDGYNVAAVVAKIGSTGADDQIATGNAVVRAHFLPAAATLFGSEAAAYSQFAGNIYTARNTHGGKGRCIDCHDPHTGHLPADAEIAAKCGVCHFNEAGAPVASFLELEETRQFGFEGDVDGDGVEETLKAELNGLGAAVLSAMNSYAAAKSLPALCAADNRFYIQAGAGACGEGSNGTAYNQFTPRLLRAAFNYLMWENDVGAWAHNPRYVVEVLFDTINDLRDGGATVPAGLKRAFNGHFGGAEDASPYSALVYHGGPAYWGTSDMAGNMGFTSAACYQCHGGKGGLDAYLAGMPAALGAGAMANKVNAFECSTCHTDGDDMTGVRGDIGTVYFPPQKASAAGTGEVAVDAGTLPESFALCGTCHSGRENGASVDARIGSKTDDDWDIGFVNPHYLGAAAIVLGSEVGALYQYGTNHYSGKPVNWGDDNGNAPGPHGSPHGAACTGCHDAKASKHTFEVDLAACASCHTGPYALEPKKLEVEDAAEELYAAIKAYATSQSKTICYNGASHPYWFADDDSDGTCDPAAGSAMLNPKALKAAYNFKWAHAEPGAYAHNLEYMMEALYDSIVDLGGVPTFQRPTAAQPDP